MVKKYVGLQQTEMEETFFEQTDLYKTLSVLWARSCRKVMQLLSYLNLEEEV